MPQSKFEQGVRRRCSVNERSATSTQVSIDYSAISGGIISFLFLREGDKATLHPHDIEKSRLISNAELEIVAKVAFEIMEQKKT
jgi:hypothetical protein